MLFFVVTSYLTAIASSFFGAFVYFKNPKNAVNKSFIFLACTVALWAVGIANEVTSQNADIAEWWLRFFHIGVCFIPIAFFHFSMNVIDSFQKNKRVIILGYIIAVSFIVIIPTSLFIAGVQKTSFFPYYLKPAFLYHFFMLYFIFYPALAEWKLLRTYQISKGNKGKQAIYVFVAGLIGFLGGLTSYLPAYKVDVFPLMNGFVFVYVLTLFIAVLKHNLMDVNIIIKKTLVFTGIVVISVCAVSFPFMLIQFIIGSALGIPRFAFVFLGAMTATLIYRPIARRLVDLTDKYLFQKKINYRTLLREASGYLAQLDSLKPQARRIVSFLLKRARIHNASVYVFETSQDAYVLKASRPAVRDAELLRLTQFHAMIQCFYKNQAPVHLEQLLDEAKTDKQTGFPIKDFGNDRQKIIQLMKSLKAEAVIPCFGGPAQPKQLKKQGQPTHLRGILFLGHQKSDEPYTEEDLDVFFTLGQESSIAFENARLYDEALLRSQELMKINREMNIAQSQLIKAVREAEQAKEQESKSKEEALEAKKKAEEMEMELIRRENLVFVERLVKGLQHEIFNPLLVVRMSIDHIDRSFKQFRKYYRETLPHANEEQKAEVEQHFDLYRKSVSLQRQTAEHIQHMVDILRQMQKPDDHTVQPLDFKGYWATALPIIEAQSHGDVLEEVKIDFEIQKTLPRVMGNVTQLTQVFLNLYRNALYAVKDREEKEISLEAKEDPENKDFLRVEFADNGTGINPEVLPKIFDYLFTTKGEKGQGIGLNMCKMIIERFGGNLECKSELEKGTTFIVRLPFAKEDTTTEEEEISENDECAN